MLLFGHKIDRKRSKYSTGICSDVNKLNYSHSLRPEDNGNDCVVEVVLEFLQLSCSLVHENIPLKKGDKLSFKKLGGRPALVYECKVMFSRTNLSVLGLYNNIVVMHGIDRRNRIFSEIFPINDMNLTFLQELTQVFK